MPPLFYNTQVFRLSFKNLNIHQIKTAAILENIDTNAWLVVMNVLYPSPVTVISFVSRSVWG